MRQNSKGVSPIHLLVKSNNLEYLCIILVVLKDDVDRKELECFNNVVNGSGLTPLGWAMKHKPSDDTIIVLLMAGGDANVCDDDKQTNTYLSAGEIKQPSIPLSNRGCSKSC